MRSRRDHGVPHDVDCSGKIVIRNIRMRFVTDETLRTWLEKYGTIEETKLYTSCAVVKFATDFEAAGAVQRENGVRRFGSVASIKHAEPEMLWHVERSDTLQGGSTDREVSHSPPRRPNAQSKRSSSPRSISPGRRSNRSGPGSQRDTHPLTWLSEAADQSGSKNNDGWKPPGNDDRTSAWLSSASSANDTSSGGLPDVNNGGKAKVTADRPYDVAILAITHGLVAYADKVKAEIQLLPSRPTSHIMVLVNVDHLTPCLRDLTNDGVLFAIVVNDDNWTHNSCTLRILHSSMQLEHRNMPLRDAIDLLSKDFSDYINSSPSSKHPPPSLQSIASTSRPPSSNRSIRQPPPPSHPTSSRYRNLNVSPPIPGNRSPSPDRSDAAPEDDDPTFLPPSRHIVTLLRMLADSRVLSVGELDELATFIAERRARLTGEFSAGGGVANAQLKSRILDMLCLKSPPPPTNLDSSGPNQRHPANSVTPPQATSGPAANDLASKLKNPSVQQALDNLIRATKCNTKPGGSSQWSEEGRYSSSKDQGDTRQVIHRSNYTNSSTKRGSRRDEDANESRSSKYSKRAAASQQQQQQHQAQQQHNKFVLPPQVLPAGSHEQPKSAYESLRQRQQAPSQSPSLLGGPMQPGAPQMMPVASMMPGPHYATGGFIPGAMPFMYPGQPISAPQPSMTGSQSQQAGPGSSQHKHWPPPYF